MTGCCHIKCSIITLSTIKIIPAGKYAKFSVHGHMEETDELYYT